VQTISPEDQKALINSVEEAIVESKGGLSPNDAIEKIASKYQYGPAHVALIVGAFNKSKAVHVLGASHDKSAAEFELADAALITQKMFGPTKVEPVEKVACVVPTQKMSSVDLMQTFVEKTAAVKKRAAANPSPASQLTVMHKFACMQDKIENSLKQSVSFNKIKFQDSLDKVAEEMRPMSEKQFRKTAQLMVNSYPKHSTSFIKLLSNKVNRPLTGMQKTAHAAVFPLQEPYISVTEMFNYAEKLADAQNALMKFQKAASYNIAKDFISDLAATSVSGAIGSPKAGGKIKGLVDSGQKKNLDSALDPNFFNQLKEVDARRNFFDLTLYDPYLNKYEISELANSFNDVSMLYPEVIKNKAMLRRLMLENLERGGIGDSVDASNIAKIRESNYKSDKIRQEQADALMAKVSPEELPKEDVEVAPRQSIVGKLFEGHKERKAAQGMGGKHTPNVPLKDNAIAKELDRREVALDREINNLPTNVLVEELGVTKEVMKQLLKDYEAGKPLGEAQGIVDNFYKIINDREDKPRRERVVANELRGTSLSEIAQKSGTFQSLKQVDQVIRRGMSGEELEGEDANIWEAFQDIKGK